MNNDYSAPRESHFENEEDDIAEEIQNAGFFSALAWSFILPPQLPTLSTLLAGDVPQVSKKYLVFPEVCFKIIVEIT